MKSCGFDFEQHPAVYHMNVPYGLMLMAMVAMMTTMIYTLTQRIIHDGLMGLVMLSRSQTQYLSDEIGIVIPC